MGKLMIEGFRFHEQQQLAMFKSEGKERGMFKFTKPILQAECEDKTIKSLMDAMAEDNLKGTILKAYRKNTDGHWDFCMQMEGRQKGTWGGEQTSEAKAREAAVEQKAKPTEETPVPTGDKKTKKQSSKADEGERE